MTINNGVLAVNPLSHLFLFLGSGEATGPLDVCWGFSSIYIIRFNLFTFIQLGLTLMDLDELNKIQKPLMHAILPKKGYSSKTCCHVVFGPRTYLGIGASERPCHRKRSPTNADVCQTYQIRPRPQQTTSHRTS